MPANPRTPDQNNPLAPVALRPERRTRRTYRDPTGSDATGAANKDDKTGSIARARALRRALLEGDHRD